jgi:hypothetical protein
MILALAVLIAGAEPAPRGCADHWSVELDRDSFASNGAGRTFTGEQLSAFRAKVQSALKSAVGDACRKGSVGPTLAREVRTIRVFSASGATEPHLYAAGKQRLNLEWMFAEENLAVPSRAEIVGGLTCWVDPRASACLEPND